MRSLITGGTGFIGRAIAAELSRLKTNVVIFDRSYSEISNTIHRVGNILDRHALDEAVQDVDEIYHLAALLGTTELQESPETAIDTNIKGLLNALEAAREGRIARFFFPTKANTWLNIYTITKKTGEEICQLYRKVHLIDVRVLRWLNAYGPGQKIRPVRKAIPLFIIQALNNLPIEIWGDGSQRMDLIHVDDLAYVTVAFMRSTERFDHVVDTGFFHTVSVEETAKMIVEMTGSKSELVYLPMRPGEDAGTYSHLNKASDLLALPRMAIPLGDGLSQTIEYYRNDLEDQEMKRALRFYYGDEKLDKDSLTLLGRRLRDARPT